MRHGTVRHGEPWKVQKPNKDYNKYQKLRTCHLGLMPSRCLKIEVQRQRRDCPVWLHQKKPTHSTDTVRRVATISLHHHKLTDAVTRVSPCHCIITNPQTPLRRSSNHMVYHPNHHTWATTTGGYGIRTCLWC